MAKRKFSTGGKIYFTLDNYGRRRAHKYDGESGTSTMNTDGTGGASIIKMDMSDLVPMAINSGSGTEESGQEQDKGSPALKALSDMTSAFKQYSETVNSSPDFDPQVDYLAINRERQSDPGAMSIDMTGQLIEGIANLKQGKRAPLSEKMGITNHHGKYVNANGGQLRSRRVANRFEAGGEAGGGDVEKYTNAVATAGALTGNAFNQAQIADTRVLEEDIKEAGNMQTNASSNDDLMNAWNQRHELNHISWKDVWSKNMGQAVGNGISGGAQGMEAGKQFGTVGAIVGGVLGTASSITGSLVGRRRARRKARELNALADTANNRQTTTLENATSNVDTNNDLGVLGNYSAYGGGIHINPKNKGKLTATSKRTGKSFSELAHSKNPLTRKRAIFALNARKWHHGKKHAFGGDLESNGANWDLGFTSIGNGGTHEMNPYEGVQMGMDSKGIPNLVEQGEVVYNDYVFSNRLNATPNLLQAYNLPKKYKGMTFSDIAAKISGETKERPNDPISQKGYEDQMERLIQAQEYVRQAQQQEQAIQQAALMQQAQQYAAQQQAQQQAYQNALAQQAYNNQQLGAMQGMVSPEEQMGLGQYGCGGGLKFACGGRKFSHGGKRGRLFSGDDEYSQYFADNGIADTPWAEYAYQQGLENASELDNTPAAALVSQLPEWYSALLKEGNNKQIGQLLEMMDSTDPKVQQYLEENYPGYKDYKDSLQSLYKKDKPYQTWMRYAPAMGSAVGLGLSAFWKPNKDYANAIQAAADAAGRFERVGWNPVGNYLQYRPFDTQYALNQLNSQFGATNRAAINNANGNRATAMANLLAAQHNYGNQVGGLYAQALQYNDAQRKATEEFNRATNLANSEGFLKAAMANQSAGRAAMNSRLQGTVYAQNMLNDLDVGRRNSIASNLTGLFNNLGNIGSENFAFNQLKDNGYLMYNYDDRTGRNGYKRAKGGYLTMGNRERGRRRK